ncbi:MAG: SCP2 sterol-binding domain-containing protein [Actinobacteria bacterium]|nr:SCP2 sterol-binding domain-containing protein [Actinomycetota bacterium]
MTELDESLLEALAERSRERPITAFNGVVRFDVRDGDRVDEWYLTIAKGVVTVGRKGGAPDCVVTGDVATFDAVLSGKANAMAALLRGALDAQGKVVLLTALQRLFPGSPGAVGLPTAGYAERLS